MSDPTGAPCRTDYKAAHNEGPRPMPPKLIVIHDTEGGTAESIARYFTSKTSGGSAHLVVDDNACYRCMPDTDIPWGAPPANTPGLHIEMCGFARWSSDDWHHHEAMLHRCAYKVAYWCKEYGIPPIHLTVGALKSGSRGIVTHADVTAAWHLTTHTDPGKGFPMPYFLDLVRDYLSPPKPPPLKHYQMTGPEGVTRTMTEGELHDYIDRQQDAHKDDPDTDPDLVYTYIRRAAGFPPP